MIAWIHGAKSTARSFNYLRSLLPEHPALVFEYRVETPLEKNIAALSLVLDQTPVKAIVGHSLGGVMGALMKIRHNVPRLVTISSPLAGSAVANFLPISRMMYDVASWRPVYGEISRHEFDPTTRCIVSTNDGGFSDGVVTVASQMNCRGAEIIKVDINHFEVLLDPYVADLIQEHLF